MTRKETQRLKRERIIEENGIIFLDNVSKSYSSGSPALNGVSLSIGRGEFVFIVGDSGSGKSTLIKLLLRELTATSGSVYVMGNDLAKLKHRQIPRFRRNLGVVFQDFRLLNDRNVYENVAFYRKKMDDMGVEPGDIKGIEDALAAAYPDWSVRRAFTAQIIINHVEARDDEVIDNMQQALDRAVENGVKNLVVQPTHLMHGAEYDEMVEVIDNYKDKFESVAIAEPMLGEVGDDATVINDDKKAVAQAITDEACKVAGYDSMEAAAEDGTAFVFMGHGTSHTANVTYDQMQTQMEDLGFTNAFIGTVEGEPEDTACEEVIAKVKDAGFKKVVLRPLMVVAGDHANNDMAGDDEDSWKSQFEASGAFDSVDCQIEGLGRVAAVEDLYVAHTKDAIDSLGTADDAAEVTDDTEEASDDAAAEETTDDAADTTEEAAE